MQKNNVINTCNTLLKNNAVFVCYRKPGEKVNFIIQKNSKTNKIPFDKISEYSGFIFSEFETKDYLYLIKPDICFSEDTLQDVSMIKNNCFNNIQAPIIDSLKQEYLFELNVGGL